MKFKLRDLFSHNFQYSITSCGCPVATAPGMKKPPGGPDGSSGAIMAVSIGLAGAPDGLNTSTYDFLRAVPMIHRKCGKQCLVF